MKKSRYILSLIACAIVTSVITLFVSSAFSTRASQYDPTLEKWYNRLEEIRKLLKDEYIEELDDDTLMLGAVDGMLASANDIYTYYYTPEDMSELNEADTGNYVGIGVLVQANKDELIEVVRVYKNGPAAEGGLVPGDVLLEADGYPLKASTMDELDDSVAHIKGYEGQAFTLTYKHGDEVKTVELVRRSVDIEQVNYTMLENSVGYVQIYQFEGNTTEGFFEALDFFTANNAKGLIVDLRQNPGGNLSEVLAVADKMMPEGTILSMTNRQGKTTTFTSDAYYYGLPMTVLIDEHSASASEVFAGAMKDTGMATIVGTQSFGKGIVQTVYTFPEDKAGMQMTTEKYYTPSGTCIHGIGITPDIIVESSEDFSVSDVPDMENDLQLIAAYEEVIRLINEAE